ncbi:hypothetical protein [Algoriella sp.]|uniref:hypothetical protein n=1 Tax=Algoriella sp. TaxID=1872434 RepID=UPI002FC95124
MYEFIIGLTLLFLFIILIVFLIGYCIYKFLRYINFPKTAVLATVAYGLFIIYIPISVIYEDELFFKRDATELVEDLDFKLNDDFEIIKNTSNWGIEESYHTFILEISNNDRNRLINEIKTSKNYMPDSIFSTDKIVYPDRYKGKKIVWNYEDESWYIRHYYQPNGEGYAPTDRSISISKTSNELRFEDVNE